MRSGDAPEIIFVDEVKGVLTIVETVRRSDSLHEIVRKAQQYPSSVMYRK